MRGPRPTTSVSAAAEGRHPWVGVTVLPRRVSSRRSRLRGCVSQVLLGGCAFSVVPILFLRSRYLSQVLEALLPTLLFS